MILQNNSPTTGPSFSLKNRIARAIWGAAWLLLFRFSPKPCHAWRALILRLFGAKLGQHVHVYANVKIWAPWQLAIGNHVGIADGVTLYNIASITIGNYCVVSQGAHLCTGSHDIDSANFQLIAKPIVLQDYVWVCAEVFIAPGLNIAEGCVIAARTVLVKSIHETWSVWAGNPAQFKRQRSQVLKK